MFFLFKRVKQTYFIAGKKENATKSLLNNQKAQAAGAAILSAVTSPRTSQQLPQQQVLGVNGFNRGELVEFLNMRKFFFFFFFSRVKKKEILNWF